MMLHTQPHTFPRLALASQLTPPPSPECTIKPIDDEKPQANQARIRRPRLPDPLFLGQSKQGSGPIFSEYRIEHSQSKPELQRYGGFLAPTKPSSLAVVYTEPVSPMSSVYSDTKGSFEISRPNSVQQDFFPTLTSITTSSSTSQLDEPRDISKEIPIIPKDYVVPDDTLTPELSPQERTVFLPLPLFSNDFKKPSHKPSLSRLDTTSESVQQPRQRNYAQNKELPPPPPAETPNPKTVPEPFHALPPPAIGSMSSPTQDQIVSVSQSLERFGYDKPSRGNFDTPITSPRRITAPGSTNFAGVGSTMHKIQPTYSVSVSAPRLVRRFSRLSTRSKSSCPAATDPLEPIDMIAQKSNGVESGAMAYLPRYTNTFAGFCKNAWRMQIDDTNKALNIKMPKASGLCPSLKCKKCAFEGTLPPLRLSKNKLSKKALDTGFYTTYGVSYTWQFLFKSHVALKKKVGKNSTPEIGDGQFACIFCCAEGNGTPVFQGPEALAWHLRAHAGQGNSLDPELLLRYKIVIGRELKEGEEFDIFIPPLNGLAINDDVVA